MPHRPLATPWPLADRPGICAQSVWHRQPGRSLPRQLAASSSPCHRAISNRSAPRWHFRWVLGHDPTRHIRAICYELGKGDARRLCSGSRHQTRQRLPRGDELGMIWAGVSRHEDRPEHEYRNRIHHRRTRPATVNIGGWRFDRTGRGNIISRWLSGS
jgi:hypothetical protein